MAKVLTYTIGCYNASPSGYFWSVPIKASKSWLQRTLGTRDIVGAKLSGPQFAALRRRAPQYVEVIWHDKFEYFLEAVVEPT
ncbi:MAG: hypothetical protein QM754_09230 [Tepidisphaeraceae bacterium]